MKLWMGITQPDMMTSLSRGTADWFSPVSVANELAAQHSNTWVVLSVTVPVHFRNPPPSPAPPVYICCGLIMYRVYSIWGLFIYVMCAVTIFITAACCGCAAAAQLIYSTKTKHINIAMYITMPIPLRVVMTELLLHHFLSHCLFFLIN